MGNGSVVLSQQCKDERGWACGEVVKGVKCERAEDKSEEERR